MKLFKTRTQLLKTLLLTTTTLATVAIATPLIVSCSNTSSNSSSTSPITPETRNYYATTVIGENVAVSDRLTIAQWYTYVFDKNTNKENIINQASSFSDLFLSHCFQYFLKGGSGISVKNDKWVSLRKPVYNPNPDLYPTFRYESAELINVTDRPQDQDRSADYIVLGNVSVKNTWRLGVFNEEFINVGDIKVYMWNEFHSLFGSVDPCVNNVPWRINEDLRNNILNNIPPNKFSN